MPAAPNVIAFPARPAPPAPFAEEAFAEEATTQAWEWWGEAAKFQWELEVLGAHHGDAVRALALLQEENGALRAALRAALGRRALWLAFISGGCAAAVALAFAPTALRGWGVLWGALAGGFLR